LELLRIAAFLLTSFSFFISIPYLYLQKAGVLAVPRRPPGGFAACK
jgi:hypothetical protein